MKNYYKSRTKSAWKKNGLLYENDEELDYIYNRYINTEWCDWCKIPFDSINFKTMDHEHLINKKYGLFRNILCNSCNKSREFKTNIYKMSSGYQLHITRNNKTILSKRSKDKLYLLRLGHQFKLQNPSLFPFYRERFQ